MKIYKIFFLNISLCFLFLLCIFTTKSYAIEDIFQNSNTNRLEILNPVSHPKTGNIWEIQFTTQGIDDLAITLEDKETVEDIEYKGLYCNGFKQYYPLVLTESISYLRDYNCDGISSLRYLVNKAGDHTVGIQLGEEKEIAHNSGIFQWAKRLGGIGNDNGYEVVTDSLSNIIITGSVNGVADCNGDGDSTDGGAEDSTGYGETDIIISVFNSIGTHQWSKRLGGTSNDAGYSVISNSDGDIIVTGYVIGNADLNGDGDSTDGEAEESTGYGLSDIFISVFNSSGGYQWSKRLGGTNNDYGYSVTTDTSNKIIVTGNIFGNVDLSGDGDSDDGGGEWGYGPCEIFITVFNSSGTYQWSKRLGSLGSDIGASVTTDTSNRIIIAGSIHSDADLNGDGDLTDGGAEDSTGYGNLDIFISVFNSLGENQWSKRMGNASAVDRATSVTTDSTNNIIVTGVIDRDGDINGDRDYSDDGEIATSIYNGKDIFISVFNSSGISLWTKRLGGGSFEDQGNSVTTDSSNNIIVTGDTALKSDLNGDGDYTDGGAENNDGYDSYDIFVSVFNSSGVYQWSKRLGGGESDEGNSVITDSLNNILVTGMIFENSDLNGDGDSTDGGAESSDAYAGTDIFISKYAPDTLSPTLNSSLPASTSSVNDPTLTIALTLDDHGDCRLSLSDETYDDMSDDVDCTGDGTTSISCTAPDLGEDGVKKIYISCKDTSGNKNTSATNFDFEYNLSSARQISLPILNFPQVDATIYTSALNYDGSILYVGGSFGNIEGPTGEFYERYNLAAIDTQTYEILDWTPSPNGTVYSLDIVGDNIYVGGAFSSFWDFDTEQEINTGEFAKLNLDGTLDTNCLPNIHTYVEEGGGGGGGTPSTVYSIKATEQYIYIGGSFNRIGDEENITPGLVRLTNNSSCTWDSSWNKYDFIDNESNPGTIYSIDTYGDSIFIGGSFSSLWDFDTEQEINTGEFAKLNLDGTLDTNCLPNIHTYVPEGGGGGGDPTTIYSIKTTEQYIYIGGSFDRIGDEEHITPGLVRLTNNSSCTWDSSWNKYDFIYYEDYESNPGTIYSIDTYGNSIFIGGSFSSLWDSDTEQEINTGEFAKLNIDGTLDIYSILDIRNINIISALRSITVSETYIYVGGDFNMIGDEEILGLASFHYDISSPLGSILINLGAIYSASTNVSLTLNATDSQNSIDKMIICNDISFTGCSWETYSTTKAWTLDSTFGSKTVYVKFKDKVGNISSIYTDSIVLHTPSVRITEIGLVTGLADKSPLTVYFTSTTPLVKGVSQPNSTVYFVYDGKTYSTVADSSGNFSKVLTVSQGTNTIQYYSKDVSENQSVTKTLNLIVGTQYFPDSLLEKLGLVTPTQDQESIPEQQQETPLVPEQENEQEPQQEEEKTDIQTLQFLDENGNPLVSALVIIEGTEYYTDSNGEIKVLGLEDGKKYRVKIEIDGVKYTSEVLGASGVDGSVKVTITEGDISNGIEWKKILLYSGIGLVVIFFLILIFRRKKDKDEENNSLDIH